eukprot:g2766.t1
MRNDDEIDKSGEAGVIMTNVTNNLSHDEKNVSKSMCKNGSPSSLYPLEEETVRSSPLRFSQCNQSSINMAECDKAFLANISMKPVGQSQNKKQGVVGLTGRWSKEEHQIFLEGIKIHGKEWKKIAEMVATRTVVQIRTHAQKYFQKIAKREAIIAAGGIPPADRPRKKKVKKKASGKRKLSTIDAKQVADFVNSALPTKDSLFLLLPQERGSGFFMPRENSPTSVADLDFQFGAGGRTERRGGRKRKKVKRGRLRQDGMGMDVSELFTSCSSLCGDFVPCDTASEVPLVNWLNDVTTCGLKSDTDGSSDSPDTHSDFEATCCPPMYNCTWPDRSSAMEGGQMQSNKWDDPWSASWDLSAAELDHFTTGARFVSEDTVVQK